MAEDEVQGNPAVKADQIGLSPSEKRQREEERAAEERAKRDGPVAPETVEVDGEKITTAEAIERVNQEEGGFIGGKPPAPETDEDGVEVPEEPEAETKLEDLPDTRERLEALVKELVAFRSETADLKRKLSVAVEKANKAFRERDEANAEAQRYFERYGPLSD